MKPEWLGKKKTKREEKTREAHDKYSRQVDQEFQAKRQKFHPSIHGY